MRALRLAEIAAEAEALRLRRLSRRTVFRAVCGLIALLFLLAAVGVAHFVGWLELNRFVGPVNAALILMGIDLFIAVVLALIAASMGPGRIEREAVHIRQTAIQQMKQSLGVFMLLAPASRYARSRGWFGRLLSIIVDTVLMRR